MATSKNSTNTYTIEISKSEESNEQQIFQEIIESICSDTVTTSRQYQK